MINPDKINTINSRKFDGTVHRSWKAEFIEQKDCLLTFVGEFVDEVKHPHLGVIGRGTVSYEFYWLNRWFNVFRFHKPNGDLRNFYCNINMPPTFKDNVLDYVDLDIDILVWSDFSFEILDLDEFEVNSTLYKYSTEIHAQVQKNLKELKNMIENKLFPFDSY